MMLVGLLLLGILINEIREEFKESIKTESELSNKNESEDNIKENSDK